MTIRSAKKLDAYRLRVRLADVEPPIWRRVLVVGSTTLHELHRMIQLFFDWYDYHLYTFEVGDRSFEAPDEEAEGEDSTKARLDRLGLSVGDSFDYIYDFGDDWRHRIEIEAMETVTRHAWLPWVIDGARRGPPEDCGGPFGYATIQELLKGTSTELDDDDRATLEWLGEGFDPEEFSLPQARHAVLLASAWGVLRRKG
ncbi:MAG: plasmid pRiA4b ORF-3 family protein [Longimicrobiales bacterium]|nr:plasmid pRiA4b ORF-3 family protein [Longimicrobiales bacterium]